MAAKIVMVIGTSRIERVGHKVAFWLRDVMKNDDRFDVKVVDLAQAKLPFLEEKYTETDEVNIGAWREVMGEADGIVLVTPEYNHSTSGIMKNALDHLGDEIKHKPVAFVGYGGLGGARAVEHLRQITNELKMVPLREAVFITKVWDAFDGDKLKDDHIYSKPENMLDELDWFVEKLSV